MPPKFQTAETRAKISAACRGAVRSPEFRAKLRAYRLGRKASEATREKIRQRALSRTQAHKDALYASMQANGTYRPIGARFVDKDGYVWIKVSEKEGLWADQWKAEHRLVMERELGRPLKKSEHVHHLDDDPGNNDPGNLLVLSHAQHARLNLILNTLRKGGADLLAALGLTLRARQLTVNGVGFVPS